MPSTAARVLLPTPSLIIPPGDTWSRQGRWKAHWIHAPQATTHDFVRAWLQSETATVRVHVSADHRYELFLNETRIGRGVERGDEDHWAFDTYDLTLEPGPQELRIRNIVAEGNVAYAQHSVRPGVILQADGEAANTLLSTGVADWRCVPLPGLEWLDPGMAWGTSSNQRIHGDALAFRAAEMTVEQGHPGVLASCESEMGPAPLLRPARLPAMREAPYHHLVVRFAASVPEGETSRILVRADDHDQAIASEWHGLLTKAESVTVPARTRYRVMIDLEQYVCARHRITTRAGAGSRVRIHWQEALFLPDETMAKGHRDEIDGKEFTQIWSRKDGVGDEFCPDGTDNWFEPFWWQAGRYLEVLVTTADEPLIIDSFSLTETHYPIENLSTFTSSDPRYAGVVPIAVRALQMCSHETFMDCPFYEQLQYIGDTRLQALVTMTIHSDDRLVRQALLAFDESRRNRGITMSRFPSRVRQIIPPFSLWWVAMVWDHFLYRGDAAFTRSLLPGVDAVLRYYASFVSEDGLLQPLPGWNYVDWVKEWRDGVPPTGKSAPVAPLQLQLIYALQCAERLHAYLDTDVKVDTRALTARLQSALDGFIKNGQAFDDLGHQHLSEHTPALMILTKTGDQTIAVRQLNSPPEGAARATIYFSHYIFDAAYHAEMPQWIEDRMGTWFWHLENGLKTTIEMPEPTRSDCHAWGAHILYHYFATFLGIRPTEPGFGGVTVRARLPIGLSYAEGTMLTPHGPITVRAERNGVTTTATVSGPIDLPILSS